MNNGVWKVKGGPELTQFNKPVLWAIVGAASANAGRRAVRYAREELAKGQHNDTGLLSHSIKSKMELTPLGPTFYIYSDLEYSRFVEDGTGVHGPLGRPIQPGGIMKFPPGKKNLNFAMSIDHRRTPGGSFDAANADMVYRSVVQGQPAVKFMEKAMARIKIIDFVA